MRLSEINLYNLRLPFFREVSHSLYTRNRTEAVMVVACDESGHFGFGEGTPRHFVTGEALADCQTAAASLSRSLCGRTIDSSQELMALLRSVGRQPMANRHPAAWCAVETACLDLFARKRKVPLWRLFSRACSRKGFDYSAVLPLIADGKMLDATLQLIRSTGASSVKIKIADKESGVALFKRVRRTLGADASLRVDANAALTVDESLAFLEETVPLGLQALEQPVAREDLDGLARVARKSPVPVVADESMYVEGGPRKFVERRLCQAINLRISSCGGILKSLALIRRVKDNEMLWQLGAHVGETAVLSLAGRHLAAIASGYLFLEGSYQKYILQEDLTDMDLSFDSPDKAALPNGPGLGAPILPDKIERYGEALAMIR